MEQKKEIYSAYTEILKEELMAAMGCTEPIALAYASHVLFTKTLHYQDPKDYALNYN